MIELCVPCYSHQHQYSGILKIGLRLIIRFFFSTKPLKIGCYPGPQTVKMRVIFRVIR